MDVLIRLRLILWLLVISLWGVMIYQFLEEDTAELPEMRWISSRLTHDDDIPDLESSPRIPADKLFPPRPPDDLLTEPSHRLGSQAKPVPKLARIPSSVRTPPRPPLKALLPKPPRAKSNKPVYRARQPKPRQEPKTPKGFVKKQTRHFTIYAEGTAPSLEFRETIENLHANLMLDLAAFSPWAQDERVSIFLFRTQETYRKVTGRPAWSGGASSVRRRKIYVYDSDEVVGILAHELCHIYFDGFFLSGRGNPLWLSEGMATLVQTERGLAAPNWLRPNIRVLKRGGGYSMLDLIKVEDTSGATDDEIRLWYTQSYSVVRYLIRSQYRSSFYKLCRNLRDGTPLAEALYRAYGMPFNRTKALEYAWRYDLQSGKL